MEAFQINRHLYRKWALIIISVFFVIELTGVLINVFYTQETEKGKKKLNLNSLKAENRTLKSKLEWLRPQGIHIVIDTAENVMLLKSGDKILRKAIVSCGSGNILKDPSGKRQWVFDTPKGEYSVISKRVNPNWIKPDWAFIEEGEAIPKSFRERVEEGVLGEYALGFGDGYFIHGTLYSRMLGRNVSHGCVRVGDKDLTAVFNSASIGTKIYIF